MAGLFDMPSMSEIRIQMANEARARQAQFANQPAPPGAKGVGAIVGMLGKAFGKEDPRLTQARKDEKIIKDITSSSEGIDFSKDPSGAIMEGASKFYKAGKIQQALQLWTMASKIKESQGTGKGLSPLAKLQKDRKIALARGDVKGAAELQGGINIASTRKQTPIDRAVNPVIEKIKNNQPITKTDINAAKFALFAGKDAITQEMVLQLKSMEKMLPKELIDTVNKIAKDKGLSTKRTLDLRKQ